MAELLGIPILSSPSLPRDTIYFIPDITTPRLPYETLEEWCERILRRFPHTAAVIINLGG